MPIVGANFKYLCVWFFSHHFSYMNLGFFFNSIQFGAHIFLRQVFIIMIASTNNQLK